MSALAVVASEPAAEDRAAIGKIVAEQQSAWNAGDAQGYSAAFAEDGSFVNVRGASFRGKAAFEQRHAEIFASFFHGSRQDCTIDRLEMLSPETAYAEISTKITGYKALPPGVPPTPDGAMHTRLIEVLKKIDGKWQIAAYYNINVLPGGPPAAPGK